MVVMSSVCGHSIIHQNGRWIYVDTKKPIEKRLCKFCGKLPVSVRVKIPADLSCTGKEKWKYMDIDYCIASIVKALQDAGIDMRGSCCGHGKEPGNIHLQDGRMLLILDKDSADKYLAHLGKRGS